MPMNKPRRRQADRCTPPHRAGVTIAKPGGTNRGGAAKSRECSYWNIVRKCSNWNICTGNGVRIEMYV